MNADGAQRAQLDQRDQLDHRVHAAGATEMLLENEQLKRQLAAVTDELESFTYSVSHDLRASLRHISAFVEIVNEDLGPKIDAGIRNHLTTITDAAQHMTLMIDALMALSQLGRIELNLSRVELRPLIDEVCQSMQLPAGIVDPPGPGAPAAPPVAGLQWRIADDFPPLQADPVLVRQLLQHLISNAIKFTRPQAGRPPAQIEIGWRWVPDGVSDVARDGVPHQAPLCELFVKDNGAGFNPKFGSKLFGVFQRLHSASEFEGIGMGLALCRRIVERHGGSIKATSPSSPHGRSPSHSTSPAEYTGGCEMRFTMPTSEFRLI